jgi:hypothetical protein
MKCPIFDSRDSIRAAVGLGGSFTRADFFGGLNAVSFRRLVSEV